MSEKNKKGNLANNGPHHKLSIYIPIVIKLQV